MEIIFIFGQNRYECRFERSQGDFEVINSDFDAYMESLNEIYHVLSVNLTNNNFQLLLIIENFKTFTVAPMGKKKFYF